MKIGMIGVGSTAGRFLLGGLADRLGRPLSFMAMFVGMGLGFVIWLFAARFWSLAVFAFVYGVFYGGFVALAPAVVVDYFGGAGGGTQATVSSFWTFKFSVQPTVPSPSIMTVTTAGPLGRSANTSFAWPLSSATA